MDKTVVQFLRSFLVRLKPLELMIIRSFWQCGLAISREPAKCSSNRTMNISLL